jgi:mortality factor 4-like protein 1
VCTKQWDDWVPEDRVRKFTDENKELAAQLHTQMKTLQRGSKSVTKSSKKLNGSDFSSARGSEERHTSVAAPGGRAGQRRNRDYDIETVSTLFLVVMLSGFVARVYVFGYCG